MNERKNAKTKLNNMGKFIMCLTINYETTLCEMEKKLQLPTNALNAIIRKGSRRLDSRFLKLPEVLGLTKEETKQFNKLCKEYSASDTAPKPASKYPMNPLGEFIQRISYKYQVKLTEICTLLECHPNYLGGIMRRRLMKLNAKFLKLPEVLGLTEEEKEEFTTLCREYNAARIADGYGRKAKTIIPARLLPLLDALKENAFTISDSTIHACLTCIQRDSEKAKASIGN